MRAIDQASAAASRIASGVQPAEISGILGQHAPQEDRASPPLLERRIIQKGIRHRVQDLVRENRRDRRVLCPQFNPPLLDPFQNPLQACEVKCFGKAVPQRLEHERMVRDRDVLRRTVVLALRLGRKDGAEEIIGAHALDGRGHAPAVVKPKQRQRPCQGPAPARGEDRGSQHRLHEGVLHLPGPEEVRDLLERKRMLGTERKDNAVIRCGCLQLEIETAAETLAQCQAPGTVDPGSPWRVQDELHPAALVEETLCGDALQCGNCAEHPLSFGHISQCLFRAGKRQPHGGRQPVHARLRIAQTFFDS